MAEAVCGSSVAMGLHFPQEQLTRLTPIFARLLSPLRGFRGWHRNAPLQARNLAKTIARDKPVSNFECTRKHYEHGYNITNDNHALKYSMITTSVMKSKPMLHASRLFIENMSMQSENRNNNAPIGCLKRRLERTTTESVPQSGVWVTPHKGLIK